MTMKKIIVLLLMLCSICSAYSQITTEMYDAKVEEIANLKAQLKDMEKQLADANKNNDKLDNELSKLNKYKSQKNDFDDQLAVQRDSIVLLKNALAEKDRQITMSKQQSDQRVREEREAGKSEALASILSDYRHKKFDDLIKSSTKLSIERDIKIVGNNVDIKPVLDDLLSYFNVEELLANKFDPSKIKDAQAKLDQIKRESELLDKLKGKIEYYKDYNNTLKNTISELNELDKNEKANGDDKIQEEKLKKIAYILANYKYNYYEYDKYPYLSEILLEIISRKHPNADADINDLLNKL
jgi:hypothetical protein